MTFVLMFLAGALLVNFWPHLVSGLRGDPFPTPFSKPPGKGNSAPLTNFLWGTANLFAGLTLLLTRGADAWTTGGVVALAAGFVAAGAALARHFGKVRGG